MKMPKGEFKKRLYDLIMVRPVFSGEYDAIVDDAKTDFPDHCSGWREPNEALLLDRKQCWNCLFGIDCPIPAFKKKWFGGE